MLLLGAAAPCDRVRMYLALALYSCTSRALTVVCRASSVASAQLFLEPIRLSITVHGPSSNVHHRGASECDWYARKC